MEMENLDFLFILSGVIYFIASAKIDEWDTITILWSNFCTPAAFIKNPKIYHVTRMLLFFATVGLAFPSKFIPWYLDILIIFTLWLWSGSIGRKKAFDTYRQIHLELLSTEQNPAKIEKLEIESKKTNSELLDQTSRRLRQGY